MAYDDYGTVLIDAECLNKDFDDIDIYGEIEEEGQEANGFTIGSSEIEFE